MCFEVRFGKRSGTMKLLEAVSYIRCSQGEQAERQQTVEKERTDGHKQGHEEISERDVKGQGTEGI